MSSLSVSVKWGKERLQLDADTSQPPAVFKAQLFAVTGVPPDRQKVMFKGKQLKEDTWSPFVTAGLADGSLVMMLGSAEAVPVPPAQRTVFAEDLTDAQMAAALSMPIGLRNLGNTCYMNAVLQCLKTVPPLCDALNAYQASSADGGDESSLLTSAVRDLYKSMEPADSLAHEDSVIPFVVLQVLHACAPQFAERDENGRPQQHDAQECWTTVVDVMKRARLRHIRDQDGDVVSRYVSGASSVTLRCKEDESEPASHTEEAFHMLSCFLSPETKYIHSGLKARLTEEITKQSASLGRDALYTKESLLNRLPAYLPITIMRFYYKEKEKINAKILKDVKFTMSLDVFEFCTEELKRKLMPMRARMKAADDADMDKKKAIKCGEQVDDGDKVEVPHSFDDDAGSNNSGFYELQAVLTHKGRSSTSGHYVAWVRRAGVWFMCDDDTVMQVAEDDVLRLSGGGDWHTAYILLYGPRRLHEAAPSPPAATATGAAATAAAVDQ